MTEAEWLACEAPPPMLEFLKPGAGVRKLRLFACACCRRILHLMPDPRSSAALEVAERFADGLATDAERKAMSEARFGVAHDHTGWTLLPDAFVAATRAGYYAAKAVRMQKPPARRRHSDMGERAAQADLLRDVFGSPYRPVTADPSWLTSTAVQLARGAYDERAFDRLPILADALQDAGCENPDVLDHCRGPGPHVRGCWVVDLVLGKS